MNLNFRFILLYRSRKILRKNFKEDLASIFECYVLLLSPKPVIPKISIWLKKKENKKKRMNGGKDTNSDSNVQKYISGVLKIVIVRA